MSLLNKKSSYPFFTGKELPEGARTFSLPAASLPFAVTGDFASEAKNHCAAVCMTNLELCLKGGRDREGVREEFHLSHRVLHTGPVFTRSFRNGMLVRFRREGIRLLQQVIGPYDTETMEAALLAGRPMAVLIMASPLDWHWVTAVGMAEKDGRFFLQIADGWNRRADRYLSVDRDRCRIMSVTAYSLARDRKG